MNSRGHLIYGGSAASNMVAKIISTNQRQFNLNKMAHPSANLQRRYGDGSFEIDDSYWRQPPPPHRWDGGVARNTPQSSIKPKNRFDTPIVEIPQPQFIQLTPQLSIPVQNLQNQTQQPQQTQQNEQSVISKWVEILKPTSDKIIKKMKSMIEIITDDGDSNYVYNKDVIEKSSDKNRKSLMKYVSKFKVDYDNFSKEIKEEFPNDYKKIKEFKDYSHNAKQFYKFHNDIRNRKYNGLSKIYDDLMKYYD
jgi:predicted transposase YbfD/YdcC